MVLDVNVPPTCPSNILTRQLMGGFVRSQI